MQIYGQKKKISRKEVMDPDWGKSRLISGKYSKASRAGYQTVPRTRGPYGFGEMKYFDTERTVSAIPSVSADWQGTEFPPNVGTPNTLCVPTTGSAINQRIGRKVKLFKLRVHGVISVPAQSDQTAGDIGAFVRVLLVHDKQTNATQAQGEEIMSSQSTAFNQPNAFQSLASLGRFKILRDEKIDIDVPVISYDGTNLEQAGAMRHFDFNVVFKKPIEISFNATNGGTISDIVDHSFCIYAITSSTALVPAMNYVARAYYKE